MTKQHNVLNDLEDLIFQCQMLSGVAFILWDSLAKPQVCEENHTRSLAAYLLYEQMEKFIANFRNCIEKLAEQERNDE